MLEMLKMYWPRDWFKTSRTRERYITCSGKRDGAGAQAQAVLSTMLLGRDLGITYVHTPFQRIAHRPASSDTWEEDWETFFNLGKDEVGIDQVADLELKQTSVRKLNAVWGKRSRLFVAKHCHRYADGAPDNYLGLKSELLRKYNSTSKDRYELFTSSDQINLALHIRRGDVSPTRHSHRYTNNEAIAQLVCRIQRIFDDLDVGVSINVFSQGSIEDFPELSRCGVNFYLDCCPFTTLHNLISADILIMSKSSFSYTAALYSRGIKFYEPFPHQPQSDWIVVGSGAEFDERDFKGKLDMKLRER